ncbi:hypothetical protein [Streptomyces sp. NPDC058861]
MAEQTKSTVPVDFGAGTNSHGVDELTLGTYEGSYEDKANYFEG